MPPEVSSNTVSNRSTMIGYQRIANVRDQSSQPGTGVLHRHELADVVAVERPCIDHLLAMRVDHADDLVCRDISRLATSCRDCGGIGHRRSLRCSWKSAANEGVPTGLVSSFAPQTANCSHTVLIGGSDTRMHPHEYGTDSSRPANDGTRPNSDIRRRPTTARFQR